MVRTKALLADIMQSSWENMGGVLLLILVATIGSGRIPRYAASKCGTTADIYGATNVLVRRIESAGYC